MSRGSASGARGPRTRSAKDAVIAACDLDRTLIYSPRAFWLETPDDQAPSIVVSEVYGGAPISFMTRRAEQLLVMLSSRAVFVPVTTRTVAQYRRVRLPGAPPAFAVTSNGGEILVDGEPDVEWSAVVHAEVAQNAAPLAEIAALLGDSSVTPWIVKVNIADDLFVYAIVDREAMPPEWADELEALCHSLGWTVSVQGRKLYCVPQAVTKSAAVAEVRCRLGDGIVLAAGDSLLDQPMLETADQAFRPAHGELHEVGFTSANLTVTSRKGIVAGEELLELLIEAAGPRGLWD
ncbi:HAD family hydrolase [Herbiconiux liangxiaofengii]|uniref:HAD family hydrolase n=1 Tax=Herbiconiux liangxiaofengii TaxID=3342795 RepID=UPI0035B6DC58